MQVFVRARWVVLLSSGLVLLTATAAHAYIDPGAGSYLFQAAVGALLAAAVSVKLFWRRILALLTRRPTRGSSSPRE